MTNLKPFISIIIPCLNEETYLPLLLKSLQNQTYNNFETIIVDAKSTDQTIPQVKSFTKLHPKIITSTKQNVGFQRNLGANAAQANLILFIDADIQLPTYFLDGIRYRYFSQPCDCFTTFFIPDSNHRHDLTIAKAANLGLVFSKTIGTPIAFGALFGIKKSLFESIGGFDPKLKFREDVDLITRIAQTKAKFRIYQDPKIIYSFRRLRKQGLINSAANIAKFQLSYFTDLVSMNESEYPMIGGRFYQNIPDKTPLIDLKPIESRFKKLTSTQKKRLKHLLKQIVYFE